MTFQVKKTEKHSWQTSTSNKLGIKASSKIKIPLVGDFGIEVSGEFTEAAAEGKEIITEETTTYSFPVTIPKMTIMVVLATVKNETLILPYGSKGSFRLSNGEESYCELEGEFKIKGASLVSISYKEAPIDLGAEGAKTIEGGSEAGGQVQQVSALTLPDIYDFDEPVVVDPSLITIL